MFNLMRSKLPSFLLYQKKKTKMIREYHLKKDMPLKPQINIIYPNAFDMIFSQNKERNFFANWMLESEMFQTDLEIIPLNEVLLCLEVIIDATYEKYPTERRQDITFNFS